MKQQSIFRSDIEERKQALIDNANLFLNNLHEFHQRNQNMHPVAISHMIKQTQYINNFLSEALVLEYLFDDESEG
jgi:hypothetical protein